jgi:hypothetical protein
LERTKYNFPYWNQIQEDNEKEIFEFLDEFFKENFKSFDLYFKNKFKKGK